MGKNGWRKEAQKRGAKINGAISIHGKREDQYADAAMRARGKWTSIFLYLGDEDRVVLAPRKFNPTNLFAGEKV